MPTDSKRVESDIIACKLVVESVQNINAFDGELQYTNINPYFVVTVRVFEDSVPRRHAERSRLHLGVHSVALTFGVAQEDVVGRLFDAQLIRIGQSGRSVFVMNEQGQARD